MMEWKISNTPVSYPDAIAFMDSRVEAIRHAAAQECVWFLEHPPLYTAGTSAKASDLLDARFPVYKSGRGGEYTYHGPRQLVAYVMLDLKKRQKAPDIKKYVWQLEEWIILTLGEFGIKGERREGRVGVWVEHEGTDKKIAALGVRVRKWVTLHGISINVDPDLSHFEGIVPCGIRDYGVTSVKQLVGDVSTEQAIQALCVNFESIFSTQD